MADAMLGDLSKDIPKEWQPTLGEIRAIVVKYLNQEISAPWADREIRQVLFSRGHARKKRIPSMQVCAHRLNRSGLIGNSMHVGPLMEEIAAIGFSFQETEHAICVEVPQEDTSDEDAYRQWCLAADVDFPPVAPGSIKYASLDCSHINMGLRAIISGCRSTSTALGNGTNYDVEVIRNTDPQFAQAASEGLVWTVIPNAVAEMYPELVTLLGDLANMT